jgi:hypothetical protein
MSEATAPNRRQIAHSILMGRNLLVSFGTIWITGCTLHLSSKHLIAEICEGEVKEIGWGCESVEASVSPVVREVLDG